MSTMYQLGESMKDWGSNAMALGGVVAVLGLADGPIPDGEVVGAAMVGAGGVTYLAGEVITVISD